MNTVGFRVNPIVLLLAIVLRLLRGISWFQHGSVMTAERRISALGRPARFHQNQEESVAVAIAIVAVFLLAGGSYILVSRFHLRSLQLVEGTSMRSSP